MSGIIVGFDGSSHAQVALEWAMREASIHDEPLTVLTVEQIAAAGLQGVLIFPADETFLIDARIRAREAVAKAAAQLGGWVPPSVIVQAIFGMPAAALIEASKDADLMVVGSRGVGSFTRLMPGSVSSQVTHHAYCPVVVVPADQDA
jgi:nucleotide-binding universal stress UspA family protein